MRLLGDRQSCFSPAQLLGFNILLSFLIIRFWVWTFLSQDHMPFASLCVSTLAWELGGVRFGEGPAMMINKVQPKSWAPDNG